MDKNLIILLLIGGVCIFHKKIHEMLNPISQKFDDSFFNFLVSPESNIITNSEAFKNFSQTDLFNEYLETLSENELDILNEKLM